jgi:hypothetical protein
MARVALIACGTALAALAACTTYDPNYTPNAPNPDPTPLANSARGTILLPAGTVIAAPTTPTVVATPVTPAAPVAPAAPVVAAGGAPTVAIAPATSTFQPGNGTVTAVNLVQVTPASASTGSSSGSVVTRSAYRLTMRMDDGTVQTLDQDSGAFRVGDRVEITRDAHIYRR